MRKFLFFCVLSASIHVCTFSQISNLLITKPINTHEHWLFTPPADTINGNWTYLSPMNMALYGVNSYYIEALNKIFICGGADSLGHANPSCFFYNLSTNSYEQADSLPMGRVFGKLVMFYDSLYLIGSVGSDFNAPDGATYRFDPVSNKWAIKSLMPSPYLIECAACVWRDSVIVVMGGSTSGFNGPTDIVRVYDPFIDVWYTSLIPFYQPTTSFTAECNGTHIVAVGGWGGRFYNDVIIGGSDTTTNIDNIIWDRIGDAPYPTGVYRVSSSQFWNNMIFGPAMYNITPYGQFWGFNLSDTTWHRFLPNTLDSVADFSNFAINPNSDSTYFYIFGGVNNALILLNKAERFAFSSVPFGLHGSSNSVPEQFKLYQNYPNPFNPVTNIKYEIPSSSGGMRAVKFVRLVVYDVLGRIVKTLVNENKQPGFYSVQFDASNLSSGIYFYRLITGDFSTAKKMILVK